MYHRASTLTLNRSLYYISDIFDLSTSNAISHVTQKHTHFQACYCDFLDWEGWPYDMLFWLAGKKTTQNLININLSGVMDDIGHG